MSEVLKVPVNRIPARCDRITSEMLSLVQLNEEEIQVIVQRVPGGASNIQDIYPLAPLQEGILFHYLMSEQGRSDTHVITLSLSVSTRARVEELIAALQGVIDRHDVLRTAIMWDGLSRPVQVVYRQARLLVEEITLEADADLQQLRDQANSEHQQLNLRKAPLLRLQVAQSSPEGRWYALLQVHHIISDYLTVAAVCAEAAVHLEGRKRQLPEPIPYRNHVAQALRYAQEHDVEAFFRGKLRGIDEPTAPFGLVDVHRDGREVREGYEELGRELSQRVRQQARRAGVSAATIFHAAWALVVSHTSAREDVVFGSVLLGQLQSSAGGQRMMGMFINTLPLRLKLSALTTKELVKRTQRELLELLRHEQASLAVAQRCSGIVGSAPLFSALLNYRHRVMGSEGELAAGIRVLGSEARTNYPLLMSVDDLGDEFALIAETDPRVDPKRVTGYLHTAVRSLVEALEGAEQTLALSLAILPMQERQQVLELFNATETGYLQETLIHELFEEQVERTPEAVAVVYEAKSLTYAQLNRRANQLAWYLREQGVGADELVGICTERSLEMVVGLFAILKAGGAYVPLDPQYPPERLTYMFHDSKPRVMLTHRPVMRGVHQQWLSELSARVSVLDLSAQDPLWSAHSASNPHRQILGLTMQHLAYVIYTSGSTGVPKGVMVEHGGLSNYVQWAMHYYLNSETRDAVVSSSLSFDATITSLYLPLVRGGTLALLAHGQEFAGLEAMLRESKAVGLVKITPTHLHVLAQRLKADSVECSVQLVVVGGDVLPVSTVELWKEVSQGCRVVNEYGPTETVVGCTAYEVTGHLSGITSVPIGCPIANTQIYILDSDRKPVPIGVTGEVYIGGAGVARGYLNHLELTVERFVKDPYSADPHARMYKSGDLGRWRADGTIEYLGRNDFQVKIRGYRVELGEIAGQLMRHVQVKEAVVIAREDVPGDKRLVGYVVLGSDARPGVENLQRYLRERLPEYLVPSAVVVLEKLPLTANGKLDREGLPAPGGSSDASGEYAEPQGEGEEILAGIWQELLGVQAVGRHAHFFELGGHSLLIVRMLERLRRIGLSVPMREVFQRPRLEDLARVLGRGRQERYHVPANRIQGETDWITPELLPLVQLTQEQIDQIVGGVAGGAPNVQDVYPLAPLQEGILIHHLMDRHSDGDTYVVTLILSVSTQDRLEGLIAALQRVIDRHDVLRTAIVWKGLPRAVQVVYRQARLLVEEITLKADADLLQQLQELAKPEHQRLDLRRAPLLRLQVAQDPHGGQWYALLQLHHIICDHVTLEAVLTEVTMHLEGRELQLSEPVPYRNHVAQALQHAKEHDAEVFFRSKLSEIDEPTAPFGLLNVHGDGRRVREAREELDTEFARRVRRQARRAGVSAATLFHAAWALVVAHTSAREDVVFGSVLLGRLQGSAGGQSILGLFVNTLPLRLDLSGVTVQELVQSTQRELIELLEFEQASLAVAQRCSGIVGSAPLFSALLNYRHSKPNSEEWLGKGGIRVIGSSERTNYPILMSVDDLGEDFALDAQTDPRVDPKRLTGYLHTAMRSLIEALEGSGQSRALSLSILPVQERRQVLELFNTTGMQYSQEKLIHELFEEQVLRSPDAVAVVYEDQSLTYGQLNAQANQLGRYLREQGVGADELVGICVERSLEMVVGLFGILKAGGAYVPLDPNYPAERLAYMMRDAGPKVLLTQSRLCGRLPPCGARVIAMDTESQKLVSYREANLRREETGQTSGSLLFVIFTSGSTGRPKGAAMAHHSMVNQMEWHRRSLATEAVRRVLQFAALSFDVAFQEVSSTLCTGHTLVLLDEWVRRDARALTKLLTNSGVERLFIPPLMLQNLAESYKVTGQTPASLKEVIVAGEQLRISGEIREWFKKLPGCRLHNQYGPTETHVATAQTLSGSCEEWPTLPVIGLPVSNCQIYILDGRWQPVPLGVAGELYIGGVGVARGYLNRPELTAERFVKDPYSSDPQARMYKSGDLGRWRADGTVEYLGRNDDQVKIRGFRIELGEIESQLVRHAQVKAAVVMLREDVPGEKRLVGYVVSEDEPGPSVESLRSYLKEQLPEYMVPSAFVVLERLPLTANGKLDRRSLPVPEQDAYGSGQYETPQGEVEEILAGIWQELLGVQRVGRRANFFQLGGHSLLIMQMLERLRQVGLLAEVRAVFQSATLADLANVLGRGLLEQFEVPANRIPAGCDRITHDMLPLVQLEEEQIQGIVQRVPGGARNVQDIYPLAPLQEGILFHHLMNGPSGGDTYVVTLTFSTPTRDTLKELIAALEAMINRNDVLRTGIVWEGLPQAVQVVYRQARLPVEEIALRADVDLQQQLQEQAKPEHQRLDLRKAPLLRLQVAQDPHGGQWYALLQLHHIICDHVTVEAVLTEIMMHLEGRELQLSAPVPYRNHVAQALQHAKEHDAEVFFRSKLSEIDEPTAPFGLMNVHGDGRRVREAHEELDTELARRVRRQARRAGVSAATLFHAAWALVVAHTSAREDVVFGSVLLGRLQSSAGRQQVMGMFINTLPLRLELSGVTAKELVQRTQRELVELLGYEQASLAVAQRCSGIVGSAPLFNALLNYRHSKPNSEVEWLGKGGTRVIGCTDRTNYPILMCVNDVGEDFALDAQTDPRVDPKRLTGYLHTAVRSLTEALEGSGQSPALSLPILPVSERQQVLELFNVTEMQYPQDKLIHELFEEQVQRSPDAVAVVYGDRSLTYGQLNAQANQLGRYLREQGVGADELVGICVERSLEMVTGLLGILKSGGAYVPLDPNYPAERLAYMVSDAGPKVLLVQERLRNRMLRLGIKVIALDGDWSEIAQQSTRNLDVRSSGLRSNNLAYAIYTSGSTGTPKCVGIEHRNTVNLIYWARHSMDSDIFSHTLQSTSLNFDLSVYECFVPLSTGGSIRVVQNALALADEFAGLTLINTVPSAIAGVLDEGGFPETVRVLNLAGEVLKSGIVDHVFAHTPVERICNLYGPSETTTYSTWAQIARGDRFNSTIGSPIANTQVYILDCHLQPVPLGVTGEIYIGGAGVARGYLNRPAQTAERFIADPFSDATCGRLYKTGDLGYWRADGTIEYLGRNDHQVKIRGFRIELGEIESQLRQRPQVKDAVVLAREDVPGEKRLVAYVIPQEADVAPSAEGLREHLNGILPEYMVPSAFVLLEKLPLTPSGKLDRSALPMPERGAYVNSDYEAPRGETEAMLAAIWQELLRVERVGRHDNFFELGGHSLIAMKFVVRVAEEMGIRLAIHTVFQYPTIREMARTARQLLLNSAPRSASAESGFEEHII